MSVNLLSAKYEMIYSLIEFRSYPYAWFNSFFGGLISNMTFSPARNSMRRGLIFTLACFIPITATAGWDPVPAEVWRMKEDPAKGIRGGVILSQTIRFENKFVDYIYRIRILSEVGKAAVSFPTFPKEAYNFESRVVTQDGRIVTFNQRKDFAERSVKSARFGVSEKVVIPAGLTSDCVLDLSWRLSSDKSMGGHSPLPASSPNSLHIQFANVFAIKQLIVELPLQFPFPSLVSPSQTHKPEQSTSGNKKVFIFRDIPPFPDVPYALHSTRQAPFFDSFFLPPDLAPMLREGADAFWARAAESYYKDFFEREVSRRGAYKELSNQILGEVPAGAGPEVVLACLMRGLDARITNLDWLTEAARADKATQINRYWSDSDLNKAAGHGIATSAGMAVFLVNLLKDAGLNPQIALVMDRDSGMFAYNLMNPFQFTSYLVGVKTPGGMVWAEPGRRYFPVGILHPDYQGTPCMQIDAKTWVASRLVLSAQPSTTNQSNYVVTITPEEEADAFSVKATFTGYSEWHQRARFMKEAQDSQDKHLKELLEEPRSGVVVKKTRVANAQDPRQPFQWDAEGFVTREEGRRRMVYPFPGTEWAMWIPDEFPKDRKEPVVIPYRKVFNAASTIHLPEGYSFGGIAPFHKRNAIGSVAWTAESQADRSIKVSLKVDVTGFFFDAGAYGELKDFLGWVKDAQSRALVLTR
ncbi:MAG: hypothetical protein IPQ13_06295 [Holophagaceae bacterium]|nr:hypothetical protein [Holophagaceae bacterium]